MPRMPIRRLLGLSALLGVAASATASVPPVGPDSGKPVPRFESLKYGEVNGRQGPTLDHRILWTYHRRGLPVEIVAESGSWRRVRDPDGDLAWVNANMLDGHRMVFIAAANPTPLLATPRSKARTIALLGPGVVAQLKECKLGWRSIKVGPREGWVPGSVLWGADRCD